jgi:hypothetical protein
VLTFVRTDVAATFGAFGGIAGAGLALAALLGLGIVLLWRAGGPSVRRSQLAIPAALSAGALVFYLTAAIGQKSDQSVVVLPVESRYLYVGAALLTPVLAIAFDQVMHRSHALGAVALACLLVGVPANVVAASNVASAQARLAGGSRSILLSIVRVPLSARAPGSLRPDPVGAPSVTLAWLRNASRSNDVPAMNNPSPTLLAKDRLRLSLMELDSARVGRCAALTGPVVRHLARGTRVEIGDGAVTVTSLPDTGPPGAVMLGNVLFRSSRSQHSLESVTAGLTVRIAPVGGHHAELC